MKNFSTAAGGKAFLVAGDDERAQLRCVVQAMLPEAQTWAAEGLTSLLLNTDGDGRAVAAFLAASPESHVTSLLPFFYDEEWTTAEELAAARALARAVAAEALTTCSAAEMVARALDDLSVQATVNDFFAGQKLTWARKTEKTWSMTAGNGVYILRRLADNCDTAEHLRTLIQDQERTMAACAPALLAVPGYAEKVGDPYAPIYYELKAAVVRGGQYMGGVTTTGRRVSLGFVSPIAHETCHVLVPPDWNDTIWVTEGMAEYLANVLTVDTALQALHEADVMAPSDAAAYWFEDLRRMYALLSAQEPTGRAYMDAVAALPWANAEYAEKSEKGRLSYVYSFPGDPAQGSQSCLDLTYAQAASFLGWLIDQRGFDHAVRYAIGEESFNAAFGFLVGKMRQKWEAWLKNEAGL